MIVPANSQLENVERQGTHSSVRPQSFSHRMTRAALHRAFGCRVLRPTARHPVQPYRQLPGDRHRGYRPILPLRQPQVLPPQIGIVLHPGKWWPMAGYHAGNDLARGGTKGGLPGAGVEAGDTRGGGAPIAGARGWDPRFNPHEFVYGAEGNTYTAP